MNYYERHLGDYARDTAHLSLLEHGVYTLLLDRYYATEAPIPKAQAHRLARARSEDERQAVDAVLAEFFTDSTDGYRHSRCDTEIARYQCKQDKAKASANARWSNAKRSHSDCKADQEQLECERNANAMRTQCDGNAHQAPSTKHQSKEEAKAKDRARPAPLDLPDWLPADVWADWNDYRNARKGWTAKAKALSLKTIADLWQAGHDPRAVIDQAIERGWTGLFPLRPGHRAGPGLNGKPSASADFRGKVYESTPDDQMPAGLR